ncbi:MAG: YfhO family protein, partial [Patescibacteria group bacterium]
PRIYFAKDVTFVNPENAFEELLKIKDFHEMTLIEIDHKSQIPNTKYQIQNTKIEIATFESQLVKLKVKNKQGNWLIYSDANLPTWEAIIDNEKTPIYTANYLFKSIFVPEGEHEIIFKYPGLWWQFKYAFKNIF